MPAYYYQHANGSVSNAAHYETQPTFTPETGGAWLLGTPEASEPLFEPMDAAEYARQVLLTLPVESRARHYTHIANIAVALDRGDTGVASYILANHIEPQTPQEEAVLTQLQTAFTALLGW
ncbi:MAG: hypothetical protein U0003_06070 [Vampirovibrionales bacterium]